MQTKTQFYNSDPEKKLKLRNGEEFGPFKIAYETYGALNEAKDNAVLLFHALSGSQHVAGVNPAIDGVENLWLKDSHTGWWDDFVGPDKGIDTNKYFVICMNYLGGCYGSTGPSSIDPETSKPYGSSFPALSISDIVDSQVQVLDSLGIHKLHGVFGASVGGLCAVNFSTRYPDRAKNIFLIGSGLNVSTLQRLHNLEQIRAIEADPNFNFGDYYEGEKPEKGLALARMIAHKTYISLATLNRRASKDVLDEEDSNPNNYQISHPVESYMRHHGQKFVKRFDANTYLKIAAAWQRFDLLKEAGAKTWDEVFSRCKEQNYVVFSIDSDVCFYPDEQANTVEKLKAAGVECKHITVHSEKGHDAFLLEPDLFAPNFAYELSR